MVSSYGLQLWGLTPTTRFLIRKKRLLRPQTNNLQPITPYIYNKV